MWSASADTAGLAAAREEEPPELLAAVEAAAETDDVVVVYLHWGLEYQAFEPATKSRWPATSLQRGRTWSSAATPTSRAARVVGRHLRQLRPRQLPLVPRPPARHRGPDPDGRPRRRGGRRVDPGADRAGWQASPGSGAARSAAVSAPWDEGRRCTGLEQPNRGEPQADDPAYEATIEHDRRRSLVQRMQPKPPPGLPGGVPRSALPPDEPPRLRRPRPHRRDGRPPPVGARGDRGPSGSCPTPGWPIARMRLVDDYDGDDDRSMAANNASGFNCRRVAGQRNWSDHAFGAAIDLNPLQNPYVRAGSL